MMKVCKRLVLLFVCMLCVVSYACAEDIKLESTDFMLPNKLAIQDTNTTDIVDKKNLQDEKFNLFESLSNTAKNVYNLQIEDTSRPSCLLKDQLTHTFDSGPLESIHTWGVIQMNNSTIIPQDGHSTNNKFNVPLINILIDGKFRGGKENFRIMLDPTHTHNATFMEGFVQDAYIETSRIPHHKILIGNSRPTVGMEGAQSAYTLPFVARSQIARNFGTIRKFGLRIHGDYSYVDYDLGGLSSDTYWREFFPGAEFNGWVNIKPLAKTNGKYGNLKIGGGIVAGQHHCDDFFVGSCGVAYDYKKFWTRAEFASANGSNGATGFSLKHRQGWNITAGYKITPKLEVLARYDDFNPDKNIRNNNQREYTAGINYYIKGQALRLILNYVYCQNQAAKDSHKIIVGTQIIL